MNVKIEYDEYATCGRCGFKKYCRLDARKKMFVCKSCDNCKKENEK